MIVFIERRSPGLPFVPSKSVLQCYFQDAYSARWSYGASRVQLDTDIRVLSEFLSYLQADSVRGFSAISSLSPLQTASGQPRKFEVYRKRDPNSSCVLEYKSTLKNQNMPLRLLVENEIFRLSVWSNPSNDIKRGTDHVGNLEKIMTDVSS